MNELPKAMMMRKAAPAKPGTSRKARIAVHFATTIPNGAMNMPAMPVRASALTRGIRLRSVSKFSMSLV